MNSFDGFNGNLKTPPKYRHQWKLLGNPAVFLEQLIGEYGDFVHYRGLISFYLINHPVLVSDVLKNTHRSYDKHTKIYDHFRNIFGNGLVTAEGEDWKTKRKLMQPMFAPGAIKGFFGIMVEEAEKTLDIFDILSEKKQVFDFAHEMADLTLGIAGRSFFSDDFGDSSEKIRGWTEAINRYCAKPPLPILSNPRFPTPTNLRVRRVLRDFSECVERLIDERQSIPAKNDLLAILMNSQISGGPDPLSRMEICEEVLGMIIAGHETSATALTWLWYELHHHPDIEKALLKEIESVVGDAELQMHHLPELKLSSNVIRETMRLHPPFWFENRNTMEDITLGNTFIPKGSMIVFSRYSLQRHVEFWENPHDFDPSRFDPGNCSNPGIDSAFIPFGGGPRICIGRHFAMMELQVIFVTILRKYRVELDASNRHLMTAKLTMAPTHGMRVKLVPRHR
ncbi:cytochrome P450 [Luteolibacter algae]|uniref:Cytochrome P450 n=1 Tax=Luteolibacter algae TaxID=454151 RepID=A0ABW5DDN3_9BACT